MTRRRRWALAGAMIVLVAVCAAVLATRRDGTSVRQTALERLVGGEVMAPANTRVRVEIINATKTSGLARRVTRLLRDRGFDVVRYTTVDDCGRAVNPIAYVKSKRAARI